MTSVSDFNKKYMRSIKLGSGTYGEVYRVYEKISTYSGQYACKEVIFPKKETDDEDFDSYYCLFNEIIAWKTFDHPNIIKIHDVYYEEERDRFVYYIIMEECTNDLKGMIESNLSRYTSPGTIMKYLEQILSALVYMYSMGYVHNDLSLGNIMLKGNQIKIIDFGFMYRRNIRQVKYHKITPYVQPPELIAGTASLCNPNKIDVWSFATLLFIFSYGKYLIGCDDEYYLDMISQIAIPSIKFLKQYKLLPTYLKLYNKYVTKDVDKKIDVDEDNTKIALKLKELCDYYTAKSSFDKSIKNNIPINKFIKKLLNWNVKHRLNIIETYQLFCKIFKTNNPQIDYLIIETKRYNISDTNSKIIVLENYSDSQLVDAIKPILFLFLEKKFFNVHLNIKKFTRINRSLHIVMKTINIMSSCVRNYEKTKDYTNLKIICCLPEDREYNINQILESNFDRFYLAANIVYRHQTDLTAKVFDKKPIKIDNITKYYYDLLRMINFDLVPNDSFDLFYKYDINKQYYGFYKLSYYLVLSSPYLINLDNNHILEALLLIILGFHDDVLKNKLVEEIKQINYLRSNHDSKNDSKNNIDCKNIFTCDQKNHKINLQMFNINSSVTAYYCLWVIRKIHIDKIIRYGKLFKVNKLFPIYLAGCSKYVKIGN